MRRGPLVLALAALLVAGLPAVPATAENGGRQQVPAPLPSGRHYTVTLVTGDVVEVRTRPSGCPVITLTPAAAGRAFSRSCGPDGHARVVPADAAALVGTVLDPALFDVTTLIQDGYDDASSAETPLIVQYADAGSARATRTFGGGLRQRRALSSLQAVAGRQAKRDGATLRAVLPALRRSGAGKAVRRISLDRRVTAAAAGVAGMSTVDVSANLAQVGAPSAWAAGYTGAGVRVGVLDSGVDAAHPDLAGRIAETANFTTEEDATDHNGHGTHVAATVAGTGAASAGRYRGVAPDAQLVVGKVLNSRGGGTESQVILGMEWAAPRAPVVNMSLTVRVADADPVGEALDRLTAAHGTLFVVVAGNDGPRSTTISSPGGAPSALTVGAVDATDAVAPFSSRGPVSGTRALKPEIVAPGVDIVSARAAGTTAGRPVDAIYTTISGTSMAAPHVAGAVAVLKQQHPDWAGERLKAGLVATAHPVADDDVYAVGAGRLDVAAATTAAAVLPARAAVDAGTLAFPQSAPVRAPVSWLGLGQDPVDLALSLTVADVNGAATDAGAVTLSAGSVSVQPGQQAAVDLVVDASRLPGGNYRGVLVARTPGGAELRTPVGFFVEPPMFDLTVTASPLPGTATGAAAAAATVVNIDDPSLFFQATGVGVPVDGGATFRVPAGRYSVMGELFDTTAGASRVAIAGDPDVAVNADTTVTLDGTRAAPLHATVDGVSTVQRSTVAFWSQRAHGRQWYTGAYGVAYGSGPPAAVYATPTEPTTAGGFAAHAYYGLISSGTDPAAYDLVRSFGDAFPDDPAYRVDAAEHGRLARIDQRFSRFDHTGNDTVFDRAVVVEGDIVAAGNAPDPVFGARTDYVTPDVRWLEMAKYRGVYTILDSELVEPVAVYQPGSRQEKAWLRQPLRPDWYDEPEPPLLATDHCRPDPVRRAAGNLHVDLVQLTDRHGRYQCGAGLDSSDVGRRLALYRDGTLLGEFASAAGDFTVPREDGAYRLVYEQDMSTMLPVSSRVETAWTFRSAGPDGEERVPVALLSVDYTLPLDGANRPDGEQATFAVRQARGVPEQEITSFRVWTSTDNGATWTDAPVLADAGGFRAPMPAITAGQAVSLRVSATGDAGSGLAQIIIAAYRAAA